MPDFPEIELKERCRNFLTDAAKEANRLAHDYIGVEHVFIALTRGEQRLTSALLLKGGLSPRDVRNAIKQEIKSGDGPTSGEHKLTPRLNMVLSIAVFHAEQDAVFHPTDNHLLIAILQEGESVPVRKLVELGFDVNHWLNDLIARPPEESSASSGVDLARNLIRRFAQSEPDFDPFDDDIGDDFFADEDVDELLAAVQSPAGRPAPTPLLDKYGRDTVMDCVEEMLARTEKSVREQILAIPDGTYSGESATDDDGTVLDENVWVRVDAIVKGDELTLDFSRSDGLRRGFVNCTYSSTYSRAVAGSFLFFDSALAEFHNEGSMMPITVVAPEGSVVNATYPATVDPAWSSTTKALIHVLINATKGGATAPCDDKSGVTFAVTGHPEAVVKYPNNGTSTGSGGDAKATITIVTTGTKSVPEFVYVTATKGSCALGLNGADQLFLTGRTPVAINTVTSGVGFEISN